MRRIELAAWTMVLLFTAPTRASERPLLVVVETHAADAAAVRGHIEEATSRRVVALSDPEASSSPALVSIAFDSGRELAWIWHRDVHGARLHEVQAPAGARDVNWIGPAVARVLAEDDAMRWRAGNEILDPFASERERLGAPYERLASEVIDPWRLGTGRRRTSELGSSLSEPRPGR